METLMVRLDSLKIKFPLSSDFQLNLNDCIRKEITYPEEKQNPNHLIDNPVKIPLNIITYDIPKSDLPYGVKSITQKMNEVEVELSAKVLGSNYFDGININRIEQVWDTLNTIPQIVLDHAIIEQAMILRCDNTYTLPVSKSIQSIIQILKSYPSNHKYQVNDFKNESIVYKHKGSSKRERLILYDKLVELGSDKNNKDFFDSIFKSLDASKNYLRIECNISKFSDMRDLFNVSSIPKSGIRLIDALTSKENPTLKVYNKIMSANNCDTEIDLFQVSEVEYYKKLKPSQFIDLHGIRNILFKFDNNPNKVREYFLNVLGYNKSNVSKIMKDFISEVARIESSQNNQSIFEVVQEIRDMLKVA
jgi:hypothetical protein